jgi:hypothetical protein
VKGLLIAFLIVAMFFGIYQLMLAAAGWFQMATVIDDVAARELKGLERISQPASIFEGDRYAKIREGILKGARDVGVNLQTEGVAVTVENNVLEVQLSWGAPMITYNGETYLQIPMTMQREFALARPRL